MLGIRRNLMKKPVKIRVMKRKAADNRYLHKDFHGALSNGLIYLERMYGREAAVAFLRRFADTYHAPLRASMIALGLAPLRDYLQSIYEVEGAAFTLSASEDELVLDLAACPALAHLKARGMPVAPIFGDIGLHLYRALCEGTPFAFERSGFDPATGACRMRFRRRETT